MAIPFGGCQPRGQTSRRPGAAASRGSSVAPWGAGHERFRASFLVSDSAQRGSPLPDRRSIRTTQRMPHQQSKHCCHPSRSRSIQGLSLCTSSAWRRMTLFGDRRQRRSFWDYGRRTPAGRSSALARICPPVLSKTDPGNLNRGPNFPSV